MEYLINEDDHVLIEFDNSITVDMDLRIDYKDSNEGVGFWNIEILTPDFKILLEDDTKENALTKSLNMVKSLNYYYSL